MAVHALPGQYNGAVQLDFCFGCQGLWFDQMENLKLAPEAVATVFKEIHRHRGAAQQPLAQTLRCPQCRGRLVQGFDIVRSGRYITHRCEQRHGRFSSFASFMVEKGFVRQLTRPEIADIAAKVGVIHCSSCGAPVDLRKEDACSHCRSALSLLDPQAVEKALQGYAKSAAQREPAPTTAVADAIVAMSEQGSSARRSAGLLDATGPVRGIVAVDLLSVGLGMVMRLLDD